MESADPILPDLQATVLCEDVRAEISGQQTLVGVISAIPAPVLPIAFFKLCLWTRWCGGSGRFNQRSVIVAPDDESIIAESRVEFTLREMDAHATNVHVFGGVKFEAYGLHHVEIHLDDEFRMRFPLPVVHVTKHGGP
jgi:hypothetical protein